MEKVFNQPKGDFIVEFVDESKIESYAGINPISVAFLPLAAMDMFEALKYANESSDYIVKEAKLILLEHHNFYRHWEIRFSNQFTITTSASYSAQLNLPAAERIIMNVYCKRLVR